MLQLALNSRGVFFFFFCLLWANVKKRCCCGELFSLSFWDFKSKTIYISSNPFYFETLILNIFTQCLAFYRSCALWKCANCFKPVTRGTQWLIDDILSAPVWHHLTLFWSRSLGFVHSHCKCCVKCWEIKRRSLPVKQVFSLITSWQCPIWCWYEMLPPAPCQLWN